jgi:hypothetical protein
MNEIKLGEEMLRETEGLQPHTADLVARSITRGRSLNRRRRLGQGLAVLSVVGVIGMGTAVIAPMFNAGQGAAHNNAPASSGAPKVVAHGFGVPASQMAGTLSALLPAGAKSELADWSDNGTGSGRKLSVGNASSAKHDLQLKYERALKSVNAKKETSFRAGSLVYDDGRGAAEIQVLVQPSVSDAKAGTLDAIAASPEYPDARQAADAVVSNIVTFHSPTGFDISLTAYNAATEKGQGHTRALPPLTVGQLTSIARNPTWVH